MPNTTVSAKVAQLEESLGVTLIQRTTRKLNVTPVGHLSIVYPTQQFISPNVRAFVEVVKSSC